MPYEAHKRTFYICLIHNLFGQSAGNVHSSQIFLSSPCAQRDSRVCPEGSDASSSALDAFMPTYALVSLQNKHAWKCSLMAGFKYWTSCVWWHTHSQQWCMLHSWILVTPGMRHTCTLVETSRCMLHSHFFTACSHTSLMCAFAKMPASIDARHILTCSNNATIQNLTLIATCILSDADARSQRCLH